MSSLNIVVGCGISGAVIANRLAVELNEKVLIVDKKDHIGGNCYDYFHKSGVCVHQYGTHIFHTDDQKVWDFVSQFTLWHPYMHKVQGMIDGQLVPIPFNLNSIYQLFPISLAQRLEEKLLQQFGLNKKVPILQLRTVADEDLNFLADYVYQKVFLGYTLKQWGLTPEEIDPSVTARVPVYVSRDNRYFQNRWQGIPLHGYTSMIQKMLDHPNIRVMTGTSWNDIKEEHRHERIFYTGAIDECMDWQFGDLPYRSIELEFREYPMPFFQSAAVVNYPENYSFTRIGEYKYFLDTPSEHTVVSFEYPSAYERGKNEPYYPIASEQNQVLYRKYLEFAQKRYEHIYFLGRLGDYKYYDMDKAVARALELIQNIKNYQEKA